MAEEQQDALKLHDLRPAKGANKRKLRYGRGEGGKGGKTATRGTKAHTLATRYLQVSKVASYRCTCAFQNCAVSKTPPKSTTRLSTSTN